MVAIIKIFGVLSIVAGIVLILIGIVTIFLGAALLPLGASALLGGALLIAFARVVELLESIDHKLGQPYSGNSRHSELVARPSASAIAAGAGTDEQRWRALVDFDPDIGRVEAALRPHGKKYVDQFASEYLILNDKSYIPSILQKVVETARQDAAEIKAAERRWGQQFSDPVLVLKFANEKFDYLISRPYGNIAILKDHSALLERDGQVTKYPDAGALREVTKDRESWMDMMDDKSKIQFVKRIASHIPK